VNKNNLWCDSYRVKGVILPETKDPEMQLRLYALGDTILGTVDIPITHYNLYSKKIVVRLNQTIEGEVAMSVCCADLKLNQVWICEDCGLEIKIVKECDCSQEGSRACNPDLCLMCCDKALKLKG